MPSGKTKKNQSLKRGDFSAHQCFEVSLAAASQQHVHTHHEFFYCTGGEGNQLIPNKSFPTKTGDFFVFPPGLPHCANPIEGTRCDAIVLMVDTGRLAQEVGANDVTDTVLKHLDKRATDRECRVILDRKGSEELSVLLHRIIDESRERAPGYRCACRLLMEEVFLTLLRSTKTLRLNEQFRRPPVSERLQDVLHHIEHYYMYPIKIEQLARMACLSRSHFHAAFKAETGYNPIQYVNRVRVRMAQRLLREKGVPILDASIQSGFMNLSHFYHTFKGLTGETPRQWVKGSAE